MSDIESETESEGVIDSLSDDEMNCDYKNVKQHHQIKYIVPPEQRITSDMITKFELSQIIGKRTKMIESCGYHMVQNSHEYDNLSAMKLAKLELMQKVCPLILRREYGDRIEEFDINQMLLPNVDLDD